MLGISYHGPSADGSRSSCWRRVGGFFILFHKVEQAWISIHAPRAGRDQLKNDFGAYIFLFTVGVQDVVGKIVCHFFVFGVGDAWFYRLFW